MSALAGMLRERVEILRREPARDALGGADGDWATIGFAWAACRPVGVGPMGAGDALEAMPRWRVTVRAEHDVAVGDRLGWGLLRLAVRGVERDPATPDRIEIRAEELR